MAELPAAFYLVELGVFLGGERRDRGSLTRACFADISRENTKSQRKRCGGKRKRAGEGEESDGAVDGKIGKLLRKCIANHINSARQDGFSARCLSENDV